MKELNELTDEELVGLYIDGNNIAFDILLKRYEEKVFNYLLCSVKSQELAEDLFQDIFLKIVVRIKNGKYVENGKFSSWLMRIVHNHVIDFHRTDSSDKLLSNDEYETDLFNTTSVTINESREQEIIDQQTLCEVKDLISLLPDNQREVLLLRYFDELSFKEIAVKTNCSINTALGRMRYALINLRHLAFEYGISMAG